MKVRFFEEENAEDFFASMNEMYNAPKRSVPGDEGVIDYMIANERVGYYVNGDGYYLIVKKS